MGRRDQNLIGPNSLDEVDLGRQIARNLETNFLLANLRLVPDFHCVFLSILAPARLRQLWVSEPINTNHFVVLGRDPPG